MAMIRFYILLIDYGRQVTEVYHGKMAEDIWLCIYVVKYTHDFEENNSKFEIFASYNMWSLQFLCLTIRG